MGRVGDNPMRRKEVRELHKRRMEGVDMVGRQGRTRLLFNGLEREVSYTGGVFRFGPMPRRQSLFHPARQAPFSHNIISTLLPPFQPERNQIYIHILGNSLGPVNYHHTVI